MASIVAHEFHGLLYVMSACLIFLIVTPKALFAYSGRKLLFVGILLVLTVFYLGTEDIDPLVYALHLTPVSLSLAVLFEGAIPGLATMAAFIFGGIVFAGNDWLATTAGAAGMLAVGLTHYRKRKGTEEYRHMAFMSLILVCTHLFLYLTIYCLREPAPPLPKLLALIAGTLLSTLLTSYIYYRVKNQERLQEELINAEKYQMIGQLAASISHEIRNPLTTTRGFLQMMGRENISSEAFERYRMYAIEGIEHANSIISDYLNYSKPAVEQPRPFDIQSEIDGLIPWVTPLTVMADVDIQIRHMSGEPLIIIGEPKKFQQCMLNLIKNGIEAMPDGGRLTVTTWLDGGYACVRIADTGVGMSEEQLKRIGMPYFTTKEKGTGLGLMVVVSLIQVMGGKITFRSKLQEGTICDLRFERRD